MSQGNYSVDEAKRQIDALWDDRDKLWRELKDLRKDGKEQYNLLIKASHQLSFISSTLSEMRDGTQPPKHCMEAQAGLKDVKKKQEEHSITLDSHDETLGELKGAYKIGKWAVGFTTTIATWITARQIWSILTQYIR